VKDAQKNFNVENIDENSKGLLDELINRKGEIFHRLDEIKKIYAEREQLEKELNAIEFLIRRAQKTEKSEIEEINSDPDSELNSPVPKLGKKSLSVGIATAVYNVLQMEERYLTIREIQDRMEDLGVKAPRSTIGMALRRNEDYFERDSPRTWKAKTPQ
jgi:hypothetical protein